MKIETLIYPLRFLRLIDENGLRLFYREIPPIIIIASLLSIPYILMPNSNYFGESGFLDRVGDFSSALTGFYLAGLVAVAAFGREVSGLDKVIEVGPVLLPSSEKGEPPERLTRREYVCLMFGYLAFLSLALTLLAIIGLTVTTSVASALPLTIGADNWLINIESSWIRPLTIAIYGLIVACLSVTTLHGLYYLVDRLYAKSPEIVKKPPPSD